LPCGGRAGVLPKGDTMAKMTLIAQHLEEYEDKSKFGYKFQKGKPLEVNPSFALNSLGSPLFTIEFDRKDHHFLDNVDENQRNILKQFSVNLGSLSKTLKIPSLKKKEIEPLAPEKPSKEAKEYMKKEQEEADDPLPEPLPPNLEKLTNAKLQDLLKERNLSTEGKKADLVKRLVEEG